MKNITKKITAFFCVAAVFSNCYHEIESDPRGAGDVLPIAGAYNVRDIGAYPAADGKHIKSGVLIRSGDLNMLTERDQKYLFKTLGIKKVVDFRSTKLVVDSDLRVSSEQSGSPDRVPAGVTRIASNTAIDESIIVPDYESIIQDQTKDVAGVINEVKDGYRRIVTGDATEGNAKEQYKAFFQALLDSNGAPVLYHCSAGKDRTGVATALLLSALGVERKVIIEDYLKSAAAVEEKYYPVARYVVKSTRENMQNRKRLALALEAGGDYATQAEAALRVSTTNTIKQRTMQSYVDGGQTEAGAKASAEQYVVSGVGQATIAGGVTQAKTQMAPLAYMSEDAIEQYAQLAGEKVKPLLTVRREYIEAAFTAIGDVDTYLKTQMNLTDANIIKLRKLYLE